MKAEGQGKSEERVYLEHPFAVTPDTEEETWFALQGSMGKDLGGSITSGTCGVSFSCLEQAASRGSLVVILTSSLRADKRFAGVRGGTARQLVEFASS
jgi:hypothetical protein